MKNAKNRSAWLWRLLGLYIVFAFVRCTLAILMRDGPTVMLDESIYPNIARSLRDNLSLLYRDQPIAYPYILYPVALIPVYLFKLPFDIFRGIQIWDTAIILTSVFPVFLLAEALTEDEGKSFLAALFTALMPDMLMGGFLMAECIVWPLTMWAFYFASLSFLKPQKAKYPYLCALFTGLLFFVKPGSIAPGALMLACFLFDRIRKKDKRAALNAAFAIALAGMIVISVFALYRFGFGYSLSDGTYYSSHIQLPEWNEILKFLASTILTVFLFTFACGGAVALVPLFGIREYDDKRRTLAKAVYIALAITVIGVAAFIETPEWHENYNKVKIHLRYCAVFAPLIVTLYLSAEKTNTKWVAISLIILAIFGIYPGCRVGSLKGFSTVVDSLMLSAFYDNNIFMNSALIGGVLTAAAVLFFAWIILRIHKNGWNGEARKVTCGFFAFFLLYNNACGYFAAHTPIDGTVASDAMEINELVEEKDGNALAVSALGTYDIESVWLETRVRKPLQFVTLENLTESIYPRDGVYKPFVPIDQYPNIESHATKDTDTLIFGDGLSAFVEFADGVAVHQTAGGHYVWLELPENKRWADTIFYGLEKDVLKEGYDGVRIVIWNGNRYEGGTLNLRFTAKATEKNATLNISCGGAQTDIPLGDQPQTFEMTLPAAQPFFTASGGDVTILDYSTK